MHKLLAVSFIYTHCVDLSRYLHVARVHPLLSYDLNCNRLHYGALLTKFENHISLLFESQTFRR